jgi:hypothetical protein
MNRGTVVLLCMMGMAMFAYLMFLAASWNAYQEDRARRDEKINELLDRLPRRRDVASESD